MERIEEAIRRAETLGGKNGLNCVAELDPSALLQAKALKEDDREKQLLWGVPVLIKDNIDVKGLHTTAGSLALADNNAASDAPVVRNLRKNGAVILGKANMTEFANYVTDGMPGGYSSRGGQVIHAVDPVLDVSGSSSGSAVAVAAGIVPMAVGTDTCHSVIACAAANGVCGLKPPVGALSAEGIIPIARTFDSAGAMARDLSDALRLYSAMRDEPLPPIEPIDPARLRIAVNSANERMMPKDERRFVRVLLARLKAVGASVGKVRQMRAPQLMLINKWEFKPMLEACLASSNASRKTLAEIAAYYEEHPETMMKYGITRLKAALDDTPGGLAGKPYLDAMKARDRAIRRVTAQIEGYDAVLVTGPTNIMHFCGFPSVTAACGEKLDSGVNQTVILYGADEMRLYAAALTIERAMNGEI